MMHGTEKWWWEAPATKLACSPFWCIASFFANLAIVVTHDGTGQVRVFL